MHVAIKARQVTCYKTTEVSDPTVINPNTNSRDEVYFVVAGASSKGRIRVPKISPPKPEDYYDFKADKSIRDIVFWEENLNEGDEAFLTILVRKQNCAQFERVEDVVLGEAFAVAGVLSSKAQLTSTKLEKLGKSAIGMVTLLKRDRDQTIGAFTVRLRVEDGVSAQWAAVPDAETTIASQQALSATLNANGAKADYIVHVGISAPAMHCLSVLAGGREAVSCSPARIPEMASAGVNRA